MRCVMGAVSSNRKETKKEMIKIERIPGVLASAYEKGTRMVIDSYYAHIAEEVVSHLPCGKILDLGTGPGYLPIEIARRSSSVHIIGVDLSPKLIDMARSNAAKAGLTNQLQFLLLNYLKKTNFVEINNFY